MMYHSLDGLFPDCTKKLDICTRVHHGATEHFFPVIDLMSIAPELYSRLEEVFDDKLVKTRLFVTPPQYTSGIHIDGQNPTIGTKWAVNFPVRGWAGTRMQWYHVKDTMAERELSLKWSGSIAVRFTPEDVVDVMGSVELDRPMLVNVNIPHNTVNPTDVPRVVLSCRFSRSASTSFVDQANLLDRYRPL